MESRRADVFFYGLFMDQELLRSKGLEPESVEQPGFVDSHCASASVPR